MRFTSTRDPAVSLGFGAVLQQGLASDGGLFVPTSWPPSPLQPQSEPEILSALGERTLAPFVEGDALAGQLAAITQEAFNFPAPLILLDRTAKLSMLELFHGPTAAFKDFGARFLAASRRWAKPAWSARSNPRARRRCR